MAAFACAPRGSDPPLWLTTARVLVVLLTMACSKPAGVTHDLRSETDPGRGSERASAEPSVAAAAESDTPDLGTSDLEGPEPRPIAARTTSPFDRELVDPRLRSHPRPDGAPDVVVHAPAGIDPARTGLVLFLHGWRGCARVLAGSGRVACRDGAREQSGWTLAQQHDAAATHTVFAVAQLAWRAQNGRPGELNDPAFARGWLETLVDHLDPVGITNVAALDSVTLVAHSAGYESALALLTSVDVDHLVLLDALYGGADRVVEWLVAAPQRRVISVYTGQRDTYHQSHALAQAAARTLGASAVAIEPASVADAAATHRVVVGPSRFGHGAIPRAQLASLLAALPLARRDPVPTRTPAGPNDHPP